MNTDKDDEFLLWVAKRLVYKYHEPNDIIKEITRIVAKNRIIKSICYENCNNTNIGLLKVVEYLSRLQKINQNSLQSLNSKTNLNPITKDQAHILDSVDIDALLKSNL